MIVFVRGAANGKTVRGCLPLCQGSKGEWKPLTTRLLATADEAVQVSLDRIRADVESLESERLERLPGSIARIARALTRLCDHPGMGDRVVIHGQECVIDEDGSTALSEPLSPTSWGVGDGEVGIEVDEDMVGVVRRALREEDLSREEVLTVMPDLLLQQASDVLLAVAETTPERAMDVAALVLKVGQARGARSPWHSEGDGEGER